MTRKRWRARQPSTMQEAMRLCLDYAVHKHNRSVAQIGDLIGKSEWTIYKWLQEGSMPSRMIRPFEFACDATFVTQYLNLSANKIMIDIPTGKNVNQDDLLNLQNTMNQAIKLLTDFYREQADAGDVMQGISQAMEHLAGHRENVRKHGAPELDFMGVDEE